jgi:hypothetical protein
MKDSNVIFAVSPNKIFRKNLAQLHQSNARPAKIKLYAQIENAGSALTISDAQLEVVHRFGVCFLLTSTIIQALEYEGCEAVVLNWMQKNVLKILIN